MDPATAFGTTAAAIQIFSASAKIVKTASKLVGSVGHISIHIADKEVITRDLSHSIEALCSPNLDEDQTLQPLLHLSRDIAEQLLLEIESLKGESKGNFRNVPLRTFRTIRGEKKVKELYDRLADLRTQLMTHSSLKIGKIEAVAAELSFSAKTVGNQVDQAPRLITSSESPCSDTGEEILDSIGNFASQSGLIPPKESDYEKPRSLPTEEDRSYEDTDNVSCQQLSKESPQSIKIKTPAQFSCTDRRCPCACHLTQYVKTPMFLKAFFGALAFRGTCANHTSRLWELKYWAPQWLLNSNIYLLFELSACGVPSAGLRFMRKVPWGGQDTIIRFSLIGDISGIQTMLDTGMASLYDIDENNGLTALHYAVRRNHLQTCKVLLQAGADRHIEDDNNISATHQAWEHILSKRAAPKVLEVFKVLFPDSDLDYWCFSPLHQAVLGIDGAVLSSVLQTQPETLEKHLNSRDTRGRTPLHWAALRGDLNAVTLLLDGNAEVDPIDSFGSTPLIYAVSTGVSRITELLLLAKANVNHRNDRGDSALHYASRHKDDLETVKVLVKARAQIDCRNKLGNTPLAGSAITNKVMAGRYLLSQGADPYSRNKYGDTPLRETIHHNCHSYLQMLLEKDTRYDEINKSGSSFLHAIALEGDIGTVKIFQSLCGITGNCSLYNLKGENAMDICKRRVGCPDGFQKAFETLISTIMKNSPV